MTPYQELAAWIEQNRKTFGARTVEEIAELAIACGFDRCAVSMWIASETFKRSANG